VLRLGADVDTVTLTHYAEYLAIVPDKIRVRRPYALASGAEQIVESLDDNEGIKDWDGGDDYFSQILLDFLAAGRASIGPVGQCRAELLPARAFVDFAVEWMNRELT
jgi:aminoglycoside N3'-acetyltransferase